MLHIRVAPVSGGEVVVLVRGELDCATSGQLRVAITALLNRVGSTPSVWICMAWTCWTRSGSVPSWSPNASAGRSACACG